MSLEIYIPLTLSQVQTTLALILSVLGIGWFFFLSAAIRYNASRRIRKADSVPVFETILPLNLIDIFYLLRIKKTSLTLLTCVLVMLGLILTNFDSIIVVNTIGTVDSCKTEVVTTFAQITNGGLQVAVASYAETEAMLQKRNKSEVPSGVIVGQIPEDPRWSFDAKYDVEPYAWRSLCSIYASETTNVNLNTSILYDVPYQGSDLNEILPEVNAEFKFRNSPPGYNFTRRSFKSYVHFNRSGDDAVEATATGSLTLMIEEFVGTGLELSQVGSSVIHRLWTLRVPEVDRMPYHRDNLSTTEIAPVPMVVKAYSCEVTRANEGELGDVNILGDISVALNTAGDLVGRKYLTAQIKGVDETLFEYTPEYWASYMAVRDSLTAGSSKVTARINVSCISIHPVYILLVFLYAIFIFLGIILWIKLNKDELEIPVSVVGWVVQAFNETKFAKKTKGSDIEAKPSDQTKDIRINKESQIIIKI